MDSKARITDELKPWFLSSVSLPKHPGEGDTLHFSKIMPKIITRSTDPDFRAQRFRCSVSDSLAIPHRRGRSCLEYKVLMPLRRDRLYGIWNAKKTHLYNAGELAVKA
jgi:hypothetical protein